MGGNYTLRILIIFVAGFITFGASAITFEKITSKDGLSNNTIFSIIQDEDGFMWFGSREGLNKYDGSKIISYYSQSNDPNSLSGDRINCLEINHDGNLLIGTSMGLNLYIKEKDIFKALKYENRNVGNVLNICKGKDKSILFTTIRGVFQYSDDKISMVFTSPNTLKVIPFKEDVLLVITTSNLYMINYYGEVLSEYQTLSNNISLTNNLSDIFVDSENNIWLGTNKHGLIHFDITKNQTKIITPLYENNTLESNMIRDIEEDYNGNIWLGTESGIFIYNKTEDSLKHYEHSSIPDPSKLNDKAIYSIYCGRENIIWIGTYFGGVNYTIPGLQKFKTIVPNTRNSEFFGKAVSQIIEDKHHKLWFASEDKGISIWNTNDNTFKTLTHTGINKGLSSNNIHSIYEDKNGIFWIGTFLGGLNRYDSKTGSFEYFYPDKNYTASTLNNSVYSITKDNTDTLWIGTQRGLYTFDERTHTFKLFKPEIFRNRFIYEIKQDSKGDLWFAIMSNVELFKLSKDTHEIKRFTYSGKVAEVQKPGIISICEDANGTIWAGTLNNGLLRLNQDSAQFEIFDSSNGLPNNTVYGIVEYKNNLWLSTNNGIARFDIETHSINTYNLSHNLSHNQFNFKSYYKNQENFIFFGSIYGVTYFHPDSIATNLNTPIPYLSNFKLFNNIIRPQEGKILEKQIEYTEQVTLNFNQNVITFEFSTIDFFSKGSNSFAYQLVGFDKDWNYIGNQKNATYTNLPHGEYTFNVKASNNDNTWSTNYATIKVIVRPPIYLTIYALISYFIIMIGLLLLYSYFVKLRNKEKAAIAIERMEKEKIKELNQHKLNFFTNISHELKTPLTLIIANIDKMVNDINPALKNNKALLIIKKHATRLHILIEQLIEFRKVENSHLDLQLKKGDIIIYLKDTFEAFITLFNKKNINHQFITSTASFECYFDADKLEKICTNLLSNSIKNSDDMSMISLSIDIITNHLHKKTMHLRFEDTGYGIPSNIVDKVFDPFFHNSHDNQLLTSTGIGLSYVKTLVNFLKGELQLKSTEGEGTTIDLYLPLITHTTEDYRGEQIEGNKKISINQSVILDDLQDNTFATEDITNENKWKIMIVEDNIDLLTFLKDHFSENYNVIWAENGKAALRKALKELPDLIISDIIMPEMDGMALCKEIKNEISTSHIPVILLTAKANMNNKLEALQLGADLYLPKPFNLKEVDILISNLIQSRNRLKEHFISKGNIDQFENHLNNKDQNFISKLTQIVIDNMDNPNFDVTQFTKEAGISRSLLHIKLKKIVNLSTSEFVKTIKINKASELLLQSDLTVSEIAYKTGYNDVSYFGRIFKEIKGESPTSYKANNIK
nr:two-component regulator propeller domain-containing protein [uncultured Carboxylicivirga sp.]